MHGQVEIRVATTQDIEAIQRITREAFAIYQRNLGLPGKVKALTETAEDVARDIREKLVLVGTLDGEPIGSVRADVAGGVGYISRFGTLPSAPKCNMGAALLERAEAWMVENGGVVSALHTSARMTKLVMFYYGAGYFIHSTTTHKGYIRALLLHELQDGGAGIDLSPVNDR